MGVVQATTPPRRSLFRRIISDLFFQVVVATIIAVLLGIYYPKFAESLKPLGDGFIRLIKMVFAPVIALTVILGVAKMESMKELGKVGVLCLVYFEVVSTFALALGLIGVSSGYV
jgi:aerobic C4-dicarboxylate transport protein